MAILLGILIWLSRKPVQRVASEKPSGKGSSEAPPAEAYAERQVEVDQSEVTEAIRSANAACIAALEAGDAEAYARYFADDSVSMPGRGPLVRGKAAIEEAMQDAFRKVRFSDAEWATIETRFNGKTAYETGAYEFVVHPVGRGLAQKMSGRYFVVWKKVGDEWKIMIDAAQPGAPAE